MPLPPLIAIEIPRMDGRALRVADAAALAQVFFATEVSSLGAGSYDARTLTTHPNQLDREDVRVLNASFRAMIMKLSLWEPLFEGGDLPWLVALDPDWDLATMSDQEWDGGGAAERIERAVREVISVKGRGVAQATKLLHLKRPALVPVIDSFVARALGARLSVDGSVDTRVRQAMAIVEHFRALAPRLRPQLEVVASHLGSVAIERSLVRVLDCVIWCSEAEAWTALADVLSGWRAGRPT